nr:hypothetical protein Iba_chr02fCG9700 [Ipomoea batatas]
MTASNLSAGDFNTNVHGDRCSSACEENSLAADLVFFFPRIDLAVELRGCEALWRTKNGFRKSRRLPTTATKGATWRLFSETSEAEASGGRLSAHEDEAISEITMWPLQPC